MATRRKGSVIESAEKGRIYAAVPTAENIVAMWREATIGEMVEGMAWYRDAHSIAKALSPADIRKGAGVLAALSPMTPWGRNIMLAARAFEDGEASGTLGTSVRSANKILAGTDPLDVLGGDKVRAFFACIADPASNEVCIDRHAFDVAVGQETNNETRAALKRKGVYAEFVQAYRDAVEMIDFPISPAQLQAVTWLTWRRMKGLVD